MQEQQLRLQVLDVVGLGRLLPLEALRLEDLSEVAAEDLPECSKLIRIGLFSWLTSMVLGGHASLIVQGTQSLV